MSFYYSYTPTQLVQTPGSEPLDERWDILDDEHTKSTSFERCNTFIKYQEYHHDSKSEDDEMMMNHHSSPLSHNISPDVISTYFREEMENSEIPKIIVEENDYFNFTSDMEQECEDTSDDDDDDVTDETIPLEQAPPLDDVKYTAPASLLEYHQSLVHYYECIMKQTYDDELVESIHNLSIL